MRILAHRGLATRARENTAAAFAAALEAGADGFETDVRRTRDGALVLHHDRLLPDGRAVAEETLASLRHEHPELQLLRVEEALERWPDCAWNLEVKTAAALEPLLSLLRRSPPRGEVLVSSFHHAALERASAPPGVHLCALVAHRPFASSPAPLGHWPRVPGLDTIVWSFEALEAQEVERARARGLRSLVYGPVTAAEHAALRALPLHGVITDDPALARRALA